MSGLTGPNFSELAIYLGDGLYADFDGYQFELSASDGMRKTNTIYLEPSVVTAFNEYVKRMTAEARRPR